MIPPRKVTIIVKKTFSRFAHSAVAVSTLRPLQLLPDFNVTKSSTFFFLILQ